MDDTLTIPGMTLRDWFAGQVIGQLLDWPAKKAASAAYRIADAMLKARQEVPS